MNRVEFLAMPEKRITLAKEIITNAILSLDLMNILGIFGFGSFWSTSKEKPPRDIDMAVYVINDSQFIEEDRFKIADPLKSLFHLPVEFHVLTPYTPMVKYELKQYQVYLKKYVYLYGQAPAWL